VTEVPQPLNWEKLHDLPLSYFSVCRALVDEVNYGISQVDPKKTVQVGSFRVDGNGNQNTYKVSNSITVVEMKIWIYWSESNSWTYFYIVLGKQTEKFTDPNKVLVVLGRRTSAHREDWTKKIPVFPLIFRKKIR